jgi:hypothetical protein
MQKRAGKKSLIVPLRDDSVAEKADVMSCENGESVYRSITKNVPYC